MRLSEVDVGKFEQVCFASDKASSHSLRTCKLGPDRFFLKFGGWDDELADGKASAGADMYSVQVGVEYVAYRVYEAFGVAVPSAIHVVSDPARRRVGLATAAVQGTQGSSHATAKVGGLMSAGMFVDIFLANWDVANTANTIITKDNKAVRIDPGGALTFRAQGGRKGGAFNTKASELSTMTDVKFGGAGSLFKHADVVAGARTFMAAGGWNNIDRAIVDAAKDVQAELVAAKASPATVKFWAQETALIRSTLKERYTVILEHIKFLVAG